MRSIMNGSSVLLPLLAVTVACGGGDSNNPTPVTPTKVVFTTQPTGIFAGAVITPAVKVTLEDAAGAVATGSTAQVTIAIATNPAAGTLGGTLTVAAVAGVATFADLTIDNVGTGYTLQANSAGLTGATSSAFNVATPPVPTKLGFTVQPGNVVNGLPITPGVKVAIQDQNGVTVTTSTAMVTVAIANNPAAGTLGGTLTVAAVAGVATFNNLTIDNAGTGYTLTATSTGLTAATSSAFNVTTPPPAPLAITITAPGIAYKSAQNNTQNPAVDTLKVTGTATWTGLGTPTVAAHLVRSQGSPSFTTQTAAAATYQFTFNTIGTYQYDCAIHLSAMTGRIVVVP